VNKDKNIISEEDIIKARLQMKRWWSIVLGDSDEDRLQLYTESFERESVFKNNKVKYLQKIIRCKTRIVLKKYCE